MSQPAGEMRFTVAGGATPAKELLVVPFSNLTTQVATGAAGSQAAVSMTSDPATGGKIAFTIPRGDKGDQGDPGKDGSNVVPTETAIAQAVTRRSRVVNVRDHGVIGDGVADDTNALQAVIAQHAGKTINIPAGTYKIDVERIRGECALEITTPGTTITIEDGAELTTKPNANGGASMILVKADDVHISGRGILTGDVATHTGTTGEWGHGISIMGADGVRIDGGLTIRQFWGDGIYVGDFASNVYIEGVTTDANRRQGISLVSGRNLVVRGCALINTGTLKYTSPGAGIDVEPNAGGYVDGFLIEGCLISGNVGVAGALLTPGAGEYIAGQFVGNRVVSNTADGVQVNANAGGDVSGVVVTGNHSVTNGANQYNFTKGLPGLFDAYARKSHTAALSTATIADITGYTMTGVYWYSPDGRTCTNYARYAITDVSKFTAQGSVDILRFHPVPTIDGDAFVGLAKIANTGGLEAGYASTSAATPVARSPIVCNRYPLKTSGYTNAGGAQTAWVNGATISVRETYSVDRALATYKN